MADLNRKMAEGHTVSDIDAVIDEVYAAHGEYDSLDERLDEMDSGVPSPASSTPAMDGTGSAGTADEYARADHVHPSDMSRASAAAEAEDRAALVELVDGGSKNLMQNTAQTSTLSGVTFAINSNGSVTITGTATGSTGLRIVGVQGDNSYSAAKPLPRGKYVVYPSNTDNTLKRFGIGIFTDENAERAITYIYNTPVAITIDNDTSRYDFTLAISNGQVCNGETLYPMLCTQAAWDISQEYQPYRPSYQELYERVVALEQANGITRSVQAMKSAAEMPEETDPEGDGEEMR